MKKILFTLIASTAALSGVSHAQSAYVGAGVTASEYKFDVPNATSSGNRSGTQAAGKVFAGYDFDKTWAVEGGYMDFGSRDYSYTNTRNGQGGNINTDSSAFYVAGKATMPINQQVSVFGKLGVIENRDKVRSSGDAAGLRGENNTNLYASVGAQYAINQQVSLTAEVEHTGKSNGYGRDSNAVSLGARYNF
jgi:OOP family OmpA-OmpF porin